MEVHASTLQVPYQIIFQTIAITSIYNSQSQLSINDSATIDHREKDGGCPPYQNAL